MLFNQLTYGAVFQIDGLRYQCYRVDSRIVAALYLDEDLNHVPAIEDSSGFGLKTTVFSDLRFNRNNATPAECETYLETLRAAPPRVYEQLHRTVKPTSGRSR